MTRSASRLVKIVAKPDVVIEAHRFSSGYALLSLRIGGRDKRAVLDPGQARELSDALDLFAREHRA
jgi:hypothetical protein